MKESHSHMIPDPGEKFSYVIVKGEPRYEECEGKRKKIPWKTFDYMDFVEVAKMENKQIDILRYMNGTIGLCARFISVDERYWPPSDHDIMKIKNDDERTDQIDKYSQAEAKKWLRKYIKSLN